MDASQIIIRPIVSEKTYVLAEAGKYTFRVADKAHKVRTASVKSKPKRRGAFYGRTRSWKKAYVQVAEGQTIPIFGQGLE
jgi:large subunit ribosomal protein L23